MRRSLAVAALLILGAATLVRSQDPNKVNVWKAGQQFTQIFQAGPAANTTTTPANGFAGIVTLAANTATVTFPTAFTAVPVCVAIDQTTPQLIKAAPTATNVAITDTVGATDVVAYICVGNPN
jgi:hypothetical protein